MDIVVPMGIGFINAVYTITVNRQCVYTYYTGTYHSAYDYTTARWRRRSRRPRCRVFSTATETSSRAQMNCILFRMVKKFKKKHENGAIDCVFVFFGIFSSRYIIVS